MATIQQLKDTAMVHQYSIRMYIGAQVVLLIMWSLSTLVEGAAEPLGGEAGVHSVSQLGFWMAIEILLVYVGSTVGAYDSNATTLYMFMLVLGIAANGIHAAFSIAEAVRCTSTLCVSNNGILISFIVLYGLLILLEIVLLYHTYWYRRVEQMLRK